MITSSYTIANVVINKSENETSYVAGIIGRAETGNGIDIQDAIDAGYLKAPVGTLAEYLADMRADIDKIALALKITL